MDTLFLIIGAVLVLISVILIAKAKSGSSEAETFEQVLREDMDLELDVDLDDEELRFIDEIAESEYEVEYEEEAEETPVKPELERGTLDHRDTVAIMYKAGISPNEIAKKLEMGKREVEIILKVKGLVK
ncbi:hypothetical protein EUAN_05700 [Andreesenia angusta]|uniref:Uncharacterized protein n=1 Tax=Andreesenia angusta TaxID=39480 RepID=A0A1S1V870_9FIRM|nr:hypothetical protein [Andreesenia angusta]OHW62786.1 hypothetical protein EUAN_05700 [Andreesenia angusta]